MSTVIKAKDPLSLLHKELGVRERQRNKHDAEPLVSSSLTAYPYKNSEKSAFTPFYLASDVTTAIAAEAIKERQFWRGIRENLP